MSGGSGGGGDWRPTPQAPAPAKKDGKAGGGGGPGGAQDPCALTETTNLNSVDQTVLATLHVGDVLGVVYQAGPPKRLVAQTQTSAIAGSITSPSMAQIIQCIAGGYGYDAIILSIRGAQCQIRIQPK